MLRATYGDNTIVPIRLPPRRAVLASSPESSRLLRSDRTSDINGKQMPPTAQGRTGGPSTRGPPERLATIATVASCRGGIGLLTGALSCRGGVERD